VVMWKNIQNGKPVLRSKHENIQYGIKCLAFFAGIAVALLFASSGIASASLPAIQNETGATWIVWSWASPLDENVSVYVDGVLQPVNTDLGFLMLTDLSPHERHRLDMINTSLGGIVSNTCTTHRSTLQILLFFCFPFLLLFFGRWYCYISLLAVVWMSYVTRELITFEYAGMYFITSGFLMIVFLAAFGEQFRRRYVRNVRLFKRR